MLQSCFDTLTTTSAVNLKKLTIGNVRWTVGQYVHIVTKVTEITVYELGENT